MTDLVREPVRQASLAAVGAVELDPIGSAPGTAPPWWERLVARAEAFVFDEPLWILLVVIGLLDIVKNGMAEDPNIGIWLRIARAFPNPVHIPSGDQYLMASPIGPALAHALGIHGYLPYATMSMAVVVLGFAMLVVGLHRAGGRLAVGVGVIAFFATPLSNVLISLGAQDPFTFLFMTVVVLFESPWLALVAGAGLAVSHLEVGIFTIVMVIVLRVLDDRPTKLTTIAALIGGIAAGTVGLELYEHHAGISAEARASFIKQAGIRTLLTDFFDELPTWLFSTFNVFWLFLVCLYGRIWRNKVTRAAIAFALVAGLVTTVTLDETRVFALLTWPLVLWLAVHATRTFDAKLVRRVTALTFVAAVVVPRVIVFEGHASVSFAFYFVTKFFKGL